jgi:hypothetical protein
VLGARAGCSLIRLQALGSGPVSVAIPGALSESQIFRKLSVLKVLKRALPFKLITQILKIVIVRNEAISAHANQRTEITGSAYTQKILKMAL